MAKILIAFYSRTGTIEGLAKAIAEGAEAAGAEVRLRRARELIGHDIMSSVPGWKESAEAMNARYPAPTVEDAEWADGIIFGTPTRFGSVSSELKPGSGPSRITFGGFAASPNKLRKVATSSEEQVT